MSCNPKIQILIGGLEHLLFSHILGIIIPIDYYIFQMGRAQPPSRFRSFDIEQLSGQSPIGGVFKIAPMETCQAGKTTLPKQSSFRSSNVGMDICTPFIDSPIQIIKSVSYHRDDVIVEHYFPLP